MSHDCCKPGKKNKHKNKGNDGLVIGLIVGVILLIGLVAVVGLSAGQSAQVTADTSVELSVDETSFDWGEIDYDAGAVTKSFEIVNTSESMLQLYDVKTSCMCTTAQLKNEKSASRKFGMHEKSTSVFEVGPGETAEVLVEFDPAYHGPSGVGPISRTVMMSTNAVNQPSLAFKLTGNVVRN